MLLQLPLHLFLLKLKEKNTGSLVLALTISGLTLHSWLFIEIQLNEFMPLKVDKNANPVKKHFLINPNILYYTILNHQIYMNVLHSGSRNCIIINTKNINIPI